ncbi:MAG: lysophospholipase L1-like esterase [Candidatus Azotimanducaceae bacterium]|jgi:lysophospholipase L1-like esterase
MRRTLIFLAALLYLLVLHAVSAVGLYQYFTLSKIQTDDDFKTKLQGFYQRRDAATPSGYVVFLGDSHTHALCTSCIASKSVNFGIPSNTIAELQTQQESYQALKNAKAVVIQIGHNDLKTLSNPEIFASLEQLLVNLPAAPRKIFNLQFPIDEATRKDLSGYNKRKLQLNQSLKSMCDHRCEVLDLWPRLYSAESVVSEYYLNDGVHLNSKGNELWAHELRGMLNVEA